MNFTIEEKKVVKIILNNIEITDEELANRLSLNKEEIQQIKNGIKNKSINHIRNYYKNRSGGKIWVQ